MTKLHIHTLCACTVYMYVQYYAKKTLSRVAVATYRYSSTVTVVIETTCTCTLLSHRLSIVKGVKRCYSYHSTTRYSVATSPFFLPYTVHVYVKQKCSYLLMLTTKEKKTYQIV